MKKSPAFDRLSPEGVKTINLPSVLDALLRSRRAVYPKNFSGAPLPEGAIEQLLDWANLAPSHKHTEPWRFVVLQGAAREALGKHLAQRYRDLAAASPKKGGALEGKAERQLNKALQAEAVLGLFLQRDPAERVPEWEELAALAIAVQNIWLGVRALGLGGYWSSPRLITEDPPRSEGGFFERLPGERCYGLFYLGCVEADFYGADLRPSPRKPIEDKVRYRWE